MSKKIDKDEIRYIASLARLEISPKEEEIFFKQFADILDYIEILNKIDTRDAPPLYSPCEHGEFQRPDEMENSRSSKEILKNAPLTDGTYFIVPKII